MAKIKEKNSIFSRDYPIFPRVQNMLGVWFFQGLRTFTDGHIPFEISNYRENMFL